MDKLDGKLTLHIDTVALLSWDSFVWLLFVFLLIGGSTYSGLAKDTSSLSLVSHQGRCRLPSVRNCLIHCLKRFLVDHCWKGRHHADVGGVAFTHLKV